MKEKLYLELNKVVAFHPQMAKALGGIGEALFVQQIYHWSDKGRREDGFIYKTKQEIQEETYLTSRQQDKIVVSLKEKTLLETKLHKVNGVPVLHYKLNIPLLQKVINQESDKKLDSIITKSDNPPITEIDMAETTTEIYTPAIAVVDKPFSFDEELSKLASDSRKHIKIIAWYLSEKNIECKTKKELDSTIKRYVKPASLLTGYTGAELRSRIKSMNNKGLTWTLDTLANGKDKEM